MGLVGVAPNVEDITGLCHVAHPRRVAGDIMNGESSVGRLQNRLMKSAGAIKGRGKSPGKIITGKIPRNPKDKIVLLLFGLESLQSGGDLIKGLVPGDLLPFALASFPDSHQWSWNAIGIV